MGKKSNEKSNGKKANDLFEKVLSGKAKTIDGSISSKKMDKVDFITIFVVLIIGIIGTIQGIFFGSISGALISIGMWLLLGLYDISNRIAETNKILRKFSSEGTRL